MLSALLVLLAGCGIPADAGFQYGLLQQQIDMQNAQQQPITIPPIPGQQHCFSLGDGMIQCSTY